VFHVIYYAIWTNSPFHAPPTVDKECKVWTTSDNLQCKQNGQLFRKSVKLLCLLASFFFFVFFSLFIEVSVKWSIILQRALHKLMTIRYIRYSHKKIATDLITWNFTLTISNKITAHLRYVWRWTNAVMHFLCYESLRWIKGFNGFEVLGNDDCNTQ
jgi:hypothetical protein